MQATAAELARAILDGFVRYRQHFEQITANARHQFASRDWHGIQAAGAERLSTYKTHLSELEASLQTLLARALPDDALWRATRSAYRELIQCRLDYELAETFYNSVYRRLTQKADTSSARMFLQSGFSQRPVEPEQPLYRVYQPEHGVVDMLRRILADLDLRNPWEDLDRDVSNVLRSLAEARPEIQSTDGLELQILKDVFFRNKGAYAVGKLFYRDACWPVALPLLLDQQGRLYVDTLICDEDELSIMFSFTRAYFMVALSCPSALVDFLETLLPNKKRSELYASIGLHKHGKTEFVRGFLEHLDHSDDQFVIAPGIKGMVMAVFTLPSYQTVFKVIKDRFPPQKNVTREEVKEKYYIVKSHDRVGRMADTQEFENLRLPKARFAPDLLEELLAVAPSSVEITATEVVISHLYTERLMTPLNLFIETASEAELRSALDEYGNAIKQLAAANIFPGDMLLKNFGVTRHGRVVFYDYDEICYLSDINFRHIPEARTPEDEMASEVWYSVAPNDVFPEEFRRFLFGRPRIKALFTDMHGELFDPDYWRGLQQDINAGEIKDVFPYRRKKRFMRHRVSRA